MRVVPCSLRLIRALASREKWNFCWNLRNSLNYSQVSAQAGLNVALVDRTDEILTNAKNSIRTSLQRIAKKKFSDDSKAQEAFTSNVMKCMKTTTSLSSAVKSADLIIEAIIENLSIKQNLFQKIESACSDSAILASNTSSLRLSDIANHMKKKQRFGGLHFFNPVPIMKLLEVIKSENTSDETFKSLMDFGKKLGKVTVACKDTPGFIVNRLLVPYLFEALRLADRGDASIKDIDIAMKLGAGYPMGPFELIDYVGLDTTKFIQDGWHLSYPDEPLFKPNERLNKLVAEGKLGKKSGEGFYKYK
ncbi:unnamed protein product [Dracunculus medinensis]|uniref:3-hydroxyacyl-CoA dehydrogenase n=1 Tax=Dracunculus medinensis TaxID=318479 RepID=A0A0N4U6B6_DRAME|nr:unnamed protein product [Dracunculus medinensis]